jgi:hypothetical protein
MTAAPASPPSKSTRPTYYYRQPRPIHPLSLRSWELPVSTQRVEQLQPPPPCCASPQYNVKDYLGGYWGTAAAAGPNVVRGSHPLL